MKTIIRIGAILMAAAMARAADAPPAVHVRLAGDSTMADKPVDPPNPEHGWGQLLPSLFRDPATVVNYSKDGRSTRSFVAEGTWKKLIDDTQPGDWVVIQFGHNDEKIYPNARGEFEDNLRRFIAEVRAKGANPVLATPCARRLWDEEGRFVDTHGDYPAAVREVALSEKVPLLELTRLTEALEKDFGPEGSKKLHLWDPPGAYARQPAGYSDNTHYSEDGAKRVATLAAQEFARLKLPITNLLALPQ